MKLVLRIAAVLSGAIMAPALAQPAPPVRTTIAAHDLELFVDGVMRDAMASEHIAGAAVAVVTQDRTLLLKGYGQADVARSVPVDPARTLFRIGSLSKTFTWILLMREVERGRVRLDAPVNDYLPPALKLPDDGFRRPVRVIDLMAHSAGFEDIGLGHMLVGDGAKVIPLEDYLARHRPRRVREPAAAPTYSNYGAALAGAIVARISGVDFQTLVEREIFRPLAMRDATFREPYPSRTGLPAPMAPALAARLATGYTWSAGSFQSHGFEYVSRIAPAGSASASAAAIARYMQAQLAGGMLDGASLYGSRAAAAFRAPIPGQAAGRTWAHGYMISPLGNGMTGYGHAGATGFFLSNMVLIPELGIGIFVTTNTDTGRALAARLPELIAQRFGGGAPVYRAGDQGLASRRATYAGTYLTSRRAYSGLEQFVSLLSSSASVRVTPTGYLVTQTGPAIAAWVPDGAPDRFVSAAGDQRMSFRRDASGNVIGYVTANGMSVMERASAVYSPGTMALAAVLVLVAAGGTVIRAILRRRQAPVSTRSQKLSALGGLVAAGLWLASCLCFALWGASAGSRETLVYGFPGPFLTGASLMALNATIIAALSVVALPLVWKGAGWARWRKLRHSVSMLLFLSFGALVGAWGGLSSWA